MGSVAFFRETGLRFDPRLGLTGGEDWKLWTEAKRLGARTGWAPDAVVYESVPASRLTFSYHYRRNRDHNITEYLAVYRQNAKIAKRGLPFKVAGRLCKFLGTLCALPFRGFPGLLSAVTAFGGLAGQLQASVGRRAYHYLTTTGD